MNEEELKKIWQADNHAPTIDFAAFRETLDRWHGKLRRKIRIDIGAQIVLLAVLLAIVWFYPKIFFMFWVSIVLTVWYFWEILRFYRQEKGLADYKSAKQFLSEKLLAMKSFMRRARLVLYSVPFVLIPAAFYAVGFFSDISLTAWDWLAALLIPLAIAEIISVVLVEIYFKIFYASAVNELKDLLRQIDSEK